VLLRGVAYRGGVKETASSPAFALRDALVARGARVVAEDPCYRPEELTDLGFEPWRGEPAEVVIVVTDHVEYKQVDWSTHKETLVVDGRNMLDAEMVRASGNRYLGIGT
jgi:UDP-N-acetyl-D-mannosaminuronic acid dehydrogenase